MYEIGKNILTENVETLGTGRGSLFYGQASSPVEKEVREVAMSTSEVPETGARASKIDMKFEIRAVQFHDDRT